MWARAFTSSRAAAWTSTARQFVEITNMPADFGNMSTADVVVRWRGQNYLANMNLYAQLFQSNETTSLSDEVLVETATGNTAFANTIEVSFTNVNTTADKSVWDAALIRFRWETP